MNNIFFTKKIRALSDEKLRELLMIQHAANQEIINLAKAEARMRNITIPEVAVAAVDIHSPLTEVDKLKKWNWAAFLLCPFWTLANKLDRWFILTLIPGLNILVMIYLGFQGNRLAYEKSSIKNINDYIMFQRDWSKRAVLIMGGFLFISLTFVIISEISSREP